MATSSRAATTYVTLNILPLLVFPLLVYNLLTVFGGADVGWVTTTAAQFVLASKEIWSVTYGDFFVMVCLLFLFIEIIKSTRTDASSIINHGLSMAAAVVCILQFVTMSGFGTSAFFFLTLMQVLDVVAGFTVTIVGAKRDFGGPGGVIGTQ